MVIDLKLLVVKLITKSMTETESQGFDENICMDCIACDLSWDGTYYYCRFIKAINDSGGRISVKTLKTFMDIFSNCPENFQEILKPISSEV